MTRRSIKIVTSDEIGFVKVSEGKSFDSFESARCVERWGEGNRNNEVSSLTTVFEGDLASPSSEEALVIVGRKKGSIDILNARSGSLVTSIPSTSGQEKDLRPIRALNSFWRDGRPSVISAAASGLVRVHTQSDDASWTESAALDTKVKGLNDTSLFRPALQLAIGGESTDLVLFDLETKAKIWFAKNAKPNMLGISEKPGCTALTHVPGSQGKKIATGTALRKLRLYDMGAQKRPVLELAWGEGRVTALAPESDHSVWAANSMGLLQLWDLRNNQMMDVLKGHGGSVRALHRHPTEPYIASVGLDRWLRVHHTGTRTLVGKVYLKQQLTAVRFAPGEEIPDEPKAASEEEEEAEASDDDGSDSDLDDVGRRGPSLGKRKAVGGRGGDRNAKNQKFKPQQQRKKRGGRGNDDGTDSE